MIQKNVKIGAFMTAPRYECVWVRNKIDLALQSNGIPLTVSGGVFYGQCMQRMLQDAMEKGIDYALTVDFDSVFEADQVADLVQHATDRDDIDALASLQARRGMKFPLFTVGQKTLVEFQGEPLKVDTAHFGLTIIKLDRLKKVPKPWFWCKPNADGEWATDKLDDDIYFWHKWKDAGLNIYIDPSVSIGHLEEVVTQFDKDGNHEFIYQNDWNAN